MDNEERQIITDLITRVSGARQSQGYSQPGSVPAVANALPPVDREADALIGQLFTQYPEARYRMTQFAFVQEHAVAEATNRIQRLEWELQQTQQALAQAQQAAQQAAQQPRQGGGFLGGLFGGGARPSPPPNMGQPNMGQPGSPWGQAGQPQPQYQQPQYAPPPPQYPPGYQPGMLQRPGSGFLGSALTTAAGVAGGMVVGNALMGLFSGNHGAGGGMFGGGTGQTTQSPWAAPAALPEPPAPPQDYVDQGAWDTGAPAAPASDDFNRNADSSWADSGGNDWGSDGGGGGGDTDI